RTTLTRRTRNTRSTDRTSFRHPQGLYEPWQAVPVPAPRLLALNEALATELGVDADALRAPDGVDVLVGKATSHGASPVAQAYAGLQLGGFAPRLGEGRGLLLGGVPAVPGSRRAG